MRVTLRMGLNLHFDPCLQVSALPDPYRTLGIDVLSDEAGIKKAFRQLARK